MKIKTISLGDSLHEVSNPIFSETIRKDIRNIFQNVVC